MTDLEQMMVERNIGDYDVAAAYLRAKAVDERGSSTMDAGTTTKQEGFKEIAADPEGWGKMRDHEGVHADDLSR